MNNCQLPLSDDLAAAAGPGAREYQIRDRVLRGLALRVLPTGGKRWVLYRLIDGKTRRVTLGNVHYMTMAEARMKAHALLGGGAVKVRKTRAKAPTFEAFAKTYWSRRADCWKPSARRTHGVYLRVTLVPFFAKISINAITPANVARWFHEYGATRPGGANRALNILSDMFNRAREWGMLPENVANPCRGIRRNRSAPRGRVLNGDALQRLGAVLERYALTRADQVDAIRLILLTGGRSGEILGLRWWEVRTDRLALSDSKTGPRSVLLGEPARAILNRRRRDRSSACVFPSPIDPTKPRVSLHDFWYRVRIEAGLGDDVRLHDLRHTFASQAVMQGETLALTGKLLGHRSVATTQRYAHLGDHFLLKAANRIADEVLRRVGPS